MRASSFAARAHTFSGKFPMVSVEDALALARAMAAPFLFAR
jgi:hypothetical protein